MKPTRHILPLFGSIALLLPVGAAEISKIQNTNALITGGAWTGAAVPGAGDTMLWDATYTTPGVATTLSQLGGDLSVLGLKVTNVGGTPNTVSIMVGFQNTSSANTLTIGAGGINMASATQGLILQSKIALGADQTWMINNANTSGGASGFNNGEDLTFQGQLGTTTTATTAFSLGGKIVTTTGAGTGMISSGYAVANGTMNIGNSLFIIAGGTSRFVTVGADVTLNIANGSMLHFQSNSAAVTSSAVMNLNGGTLKLVSNNATNLVTINGTVNVNNASTLLVGNNVAAGSVLVTTANTGLVVNANLAGSAALAVTNNASTANMLIFAGNNSSYSGALTFSGTAGRITRLTTTNSGSAAATWNVGTGMVLQVNGVNVSLGTLNGAGNITNSNAAAATIAVQSGALTGTITNSTGTLGLTKAGAGTLTLSGANTYTGATTVSGGTLAVSPGTLSGTAVTIANAATLAALASTSGTLNTSTISVSSGGTIAGRPQVAGVTTTVPALNLAAGSFFSIDTGLLGNPTAAVLSATAFAPTTGAVLKVTGGAVSVGTFPGLSYSGSIGGDGFGALSLSLPFRVAGTLLNNANSVDVQITALVKPTWAGTVNGNWDIDTSGNGSVGTANWAAASGPNTYVESVTLGNDSVIFNDTATTAAVNITTAVTPNGVSINNSAQNYSFTGTGRITGSTAILKAGTGNVTLANSGTNDFTGGTQISDGKLSLGDGATASVGTIGTSAVTVNSPGVFELNRPDAFTFTNALAGTGTLRKSQTNTATLSGAVSFGGTVDLAGGTLRFTGGGNLSGVVSGAGALVVDGGTLQLSGTSANTFTSLTTINSGTLQLNKTGVSAIAGNLLFTGTGGLTFSQTNQIADTATITYDKAINGGNIIINETIGAITMLNGNDTNAQVQGLNGFVVTGLLTAQNSSVFAMTSNNSGSVGGVNMSGTSTVRIAGNSNPSMLAVGALGITASGGTFQVGQGTGAFDAVLNLGGDVTTTGNLAFTDGGFTGTQLRQINLGASIRTFNIGTGTTTTIAPDIAGTGGGITKSGNGTLQLAATSASNYTGDTTVAAGTFLTTPAHTAGNVIVNAAGTFSVAQAAATTTMNAANFTTDAGATLTLATGGFGNPTVPVLNVSTFNPTTTTLRVTGSALAIGTNIPLIDYATLGTAFSNLTLALPLRTAGSLINNTTDGRVDLTISGIDQVKWNGNVNSVWDIDPDTTGALGTANWKTTISNTSTRYFQGVVATDTANFDDTALGTTTVNLSISFTPLATNVSNSTLTYTFGGAGKLTGATSLTKTGTGTLILANSTTYDHTGGTTISAGTLQIGDGTTNGVGFLPTGTVTNNATLTFNRPDDLTVSNTIVGTGNIVKNNANVVSLSAAATNATSYTVNAGNLRFNGVATLSGPIALSGGSATFSAGGTLTSDLTGTGVLNAVGGTLQLAGTNANTNTGLTTITTGLLQLNKPANTNAVGGDITVTGTGQLALLAAEQVPNTATYTLLGSSADSIITQTGGETFGNVIVNSSVAGIGGGQVVMRAGFTVLGTATLTSGVLGVGSGQTATIKAVNITATDTTSALLRVSSNTGNSTLNVGSGGITASGGEIQLKFNTTNFDAILNLGGNFTTTGNVIITNAGYTGVNLNVINLTASRIFNIGTSTLTTVAPDIAGPGGLTKSGNGTLTLTNLVAGTYTGDTIINAGTLLVHGTLTGTTKVDVTGTGTLGGTGTITPTSAGNVNILAGGILSPGASVGTLSVILSGGGILDISGGAFATNSHSLAFEINTPGASDSVNITGGALRIGTGVLEFNDFNFTSLGGITGDTDYILFAGDTAIDGTLGAAFSGTIAGLPAELRFADGGTDLILHVPEPTATLSLLTGLGTLLARRRRK